MLAVVSIWLCFSIVIVPGHLVKTNSLWVFKQPGDIILHGLYPIRKHTNELNFEGITWMGAMVSRIHQINQEKLLPRNLTLGFTIRDTGSDVQTGLRQTLSVLNEVLNKAGEQSKLQHIPVILGPATDELEEKSKSLYKLFDVLRIIYTTTSFRFGQINEKIIRTVPSDFIHVEALLRLLNEIEALEFSVVVSNSNPWKERMNLFQAVFKKKKKRIVIKEIIYVNKNESDMSVVHRRINAEAVIILTESNISSTLIRTGKVSKVYIEVCRFDDPLLRVFNSFGKLTKKIIIRNMRSNNSYEFRTNLAETLKSSSKLIKPNWLMSVYKKYCAKPKLSTRNETAFNKECVGFQERIISSLGYNKFNSSLTLQGVIDATNRIAISLSDTLKQCGNATLRDCLKLSGAALINKLTKTTVSNDINEDRVYSIQVLRRVKDSKKLDRRTKTTRGWTFKKIQEWVIRGSEIKNKVHNIYLDNKTNPNNLTSISDQFNDVINSSNNNTCDCCNGDQSICVADNVVINWSDSWTIALYFLEGVCLLAVLSTFVYFLQHKNSPIMILCYSWPDNITLAVLVLFTVLPMMHIGEMTSCRCITLWPFVNIVFAFYTGILLTKTLFVQNFLKCEVATERPVRRMAFSALITLVQITFLASLFVFDFPRSTYLACTSRGAVTLCNIDKNIVVLVSMTFNWLLLCALFALSVTETLSQRQNFCRTENMVAVATVAWLSYTCLIALAYFNIRVEYHLATALIQCVVYLINSAVCLALIYVPTFRLVSTWLRQHTRQQRNLTSIKRAQVMSSKRQSSGPIRESLFGGNFSTEHLTIPSERHSGYYFDHRPASAVTDLSYPTSLVRSVHEQTHVVFGYGRRGLMSLNDATSVESVPSVDWLEAPSQAQSACSSYDNLSQADVEDAANELTPHELLHEISTYWERHRSSDVTANEQLEDNVETNRWPSLEKLRTSDL